LLARNFIMKTVTVQSAATTLSRPVALAEAGEEIILMRGNVPVAKIVPFRPVTPKRQFGALRGKFSIGPEFFDPLPEGELAAWENQVALPDAYGVPRLR
jgi:antitoxin (DNA-binding transcriptional repressor) of toxin-antitoxin stability system